MPTITRFFIKTALLYLVAALALGIALVWVGGNASVIGIVQFHLLAVGWLTQMVFGVGYWLFPLRGAKEIRRPNRGPEMPLGIAYALLNVGLIARAFCEPLVTLGMLPGGGWILAGSGVAQLAAAILFVSQMWPRIKERA